MTKLVLIAFLGAALLSGCASTAPGGGAPATSPATASAPAAPVQQTVAVTVPAAAAKKVVLVITGSKAAVETSDWAAFKEEWRATLSEYARESGIAFSIVDAAPPPSADAGTVLVVHVNDYRMVGIGNRIARGIAFGFIGTAIGGKAHIDTKVTYLDLKTGRTFGAQEYNTSSSNWAVAFGSTTPQHINSIGKEVFAALKP